MSTTPRVSNIGSSETDRLKRELAEANEKLAAAEMERDEARIDSKICRQAEKVAIQGSNEMFIKLSSAQAEIERLKAGQCMEWCDVCGQPLSQCGRQNDGGEPELDCRVCRLKSSLDEANEKLAKVARCVDIVEKLDVAQSDKQMELAASFSEAMAYTVMEQTEEHLAAVKAENERLTSGYGDACLRITDLEQELAAVRACFADASHADVNAYTKWQECERAAAAMREAFRDISNMPHYDQDDAHRLRHKARAALDLCAEAGLSFVPREIADRLRDALQWFLDREPMTDFPTARAALAACNAATKP